MASMDTQCDYTKGSDGKEWKNAGTVLLGDTLFLTTVIKTVPPLKNKKIHALQCSQGHYLQ